MITCHLTKLELALDQIKKSYPKLKPADAGLIAQAVSLTGRHALADYEGHHYSWPEDCGELTKAMVPQVSIIQESVEVAPTKRSAKTVVEEEPAVITLALVPNISAGEKVLGTRNDLKTLLSDIVQGGIEYVYSGTDVGWQWAMDRANWTTITGADLHRRIKVKAAFTAGAIGIEMGTGTKKKGGKGKAEAIVEEDEIIVEDVAIPELDAEIEAELEAVGDLD